MSLPIHPIVIHFPIALAVIALCFDLGRWFWGRTRLIEAGFWGGSTPLLIAAMLGAFVSVASGLVAETSAPKTEVVHQLIESHETAAFLVSGGLALLAFWRIALRGMFPKRGAYLYLGALLLVTIVLVYGAFLGGQMVYSHGVGVQSTP